MNDYDAQLALDREVTAYGTKIGSAVPREYHSAPQVTNLPIMLNAPSAHAIGHPADTTVFQRAWADAAHAAAEFDKYIDAVTPASRSPKYTDDNIKDHVAAFANTDAAQAVERSLQELRTTLTNAEAVANTVRQDLEPKGDTATELRNTRYWTRASRRLDNVTDGGYLRTVQDLVNNASPDELGVLLQELPAYLEAKGHASDYLDTLVQEVAPEYKRARRRADVARQALTIAEANAKKLRNRYQNTLPGDFRNQGTRVITYEQRYDPDLI